MGYDGGKGRLARRVKSYETRAGQWQGPLTGSLEIGGTRWEADGNLIQGRRPIRCALRPCLGDLYTTSWCESCERLLLGVFHGEHGSQELPASVNSILRRQLELNSDHLFHRFPIWPGKGQLQGCGQLRPVQSQGNTVLRSHQAPGDMLSDMPSPELVGVYGVTTGVAKVDDSFPY